MPPHFDIEDAMSDRISALQQMLAKDPHSVFLHYSLAKELAATKRFDEAVAEFSRCIELDASYLPAYVEKGKTLRSTGDAEGAKKVFAAAMALAGVLGENHMRDHIQQQLDSLTPAEG